MKKENMDILKDPKLKETPFTVPEGYFSTFKESVFLKEHSTIVTHQNKSRRYIAIAASFTLLLGVGMGALKGLNKTDGYDDMDFMVLSDMSAENYYDLLSYDDTELTEEDIIQYLIESGEDIDYIEPNE